MPRIEVPYGGHVYTIRPNPESLTTARAALKAGRSRAALKAILGPAQFAVFTQRHSTYGEFEDFVLAIGRRLGVL
ncbi:hypothetical protein ACGFI9_20815 [Micromonospora sp. NPDC048930]|uniref:hypothetical protein n=1 Tax=Micromonospora sp. NPDC048930 TaxID=3364261 RepID=UPI0037135C9C